MIRMESHDVVAIAVVVAGASLGAADILINGDGTVLTAMIGLFGMILGYVFGRGVQQSQSNQSASVQP